jgi:hypothetical protein
MADRSVTGLAPTGEQPSAIGVIDVIRQAEKLFVAHWPSYCGIMAIGYAPLWATAIMLDSRFWRSDHDGALGAIIALAALLSIVLPNVCPMLAAAAVNFGAAQHMSGRRFSFDQSLRIAVRRSPAILAIWALVGLGAAFAAMLLVVPGLIFLSMYAVAIPACLAERLGPLKSLSRSAYLTKGNRWRVLATLCLLYGGGAVFVFCGGLVALLILDVAGREPRAAHPAVVDAIILTVCAVVTAFNAAAIGVLYKQLRIARGVDVEPFARVFD